METFSDKVKRLFQEHEELITRKNEPVEGGNGIFTRYKYPVVTAEIIFCDCGKSEWNR